MTMLTVADFEKMSDEALAELCYRLSRSGLTLEDAKAVERVVRDALHARTDHHYLYLDDPEDLAAMVGCGTAEGGATMSMELGINLRLYKIDLAECPFCGPDTLEGDDADDEE